MPLVRHARLASQNCHSISQQTDQRNAYLKPTRKRFASPDGRAWLITKQTPADNSALQLDMGDVAYLPVEK
jgi:hypothetical protein